MIAPSFAPYRVMLCPEGAMLKEKLDRYQCPPNIRCRHGQYDPVLTALAIAWYCHKNGDTKHERCPMCSGKS